MAPIETTPRHAPRPQAEESILADGGVMGAVMRAQEWTASPLGPIRDWPQSLRAAVSLALNSQFPTIIFWGPDLLMLYNDAYLPILADKHPAALGRPARELWSEIWSIIGPMLHSVLATGQATWSYDLFLPIIHNGAVGEHYFTFSYSPIRDETGAVRGVFCPVTETTARLQWERREHTLRAEAEAARDHVTHVLESMSDSFVAFDPQWRITAANASAAEAMHHRPEDLIGKVCWEEFPPTRDTNLYREFHRAMADRVTVEFERYYPSWERWFEIRAYPSTEGGLSVFFRDITARKQEEAALRESEMRFRMLADTAPGMVWTAMSDGTITYANEQWFQFCGLTSDENTRQWPQLVLHPDDQELCLAQWTQALRDGTPYEIEVRNRRYDGVYRWLLTRALPVRDAAGQITAWYGTTVDIHERKQLE